MTVINDSDLKNKVNLVKLDSDESKEFSINDCYIQECSELRDKSGKLIFEDFQCIDENGLYVNVKKQDDAFLAYYFKGSDYVEVPLNTINKKLLVKYNKKLLRQKKRVAQG